MVSIVKMKQNDTAPDLQVALKDASGNTVDVTGATIKFSMSAGGVNKINEAAATIVDASTGIVKYAWQAGDLDTAGTHVGEFEVTYSGGSIETFPNSVADRIEIIVAKELA